MELEEHPLPSWWRAELVVWEWLSLGPMGVGGCGEWGDGCGGGGGNGGGDGGAHGVGDGAGVGVGGGGGQSEPSDRGCGLP